VAAVFPHAALMEWPAWSDERGAAVPSWMKASPAERSSWCEKLSVALSPDVDRDGWEYATRFTHIHNPRCASPCPTLSRRLCVSAGCRYLCTRMAQTPVPTLRTRQPRAPYETSRKALPGGVVTSQPSCCRKEPYQLRHVPGCAR
jgi:hypothetical protein